MKVYNLIPNNRISDYVHRILVIENDGLTTPFSLPLFANGSPTLLYQNSKATIGGDESGHITLFGQTILPEKMLLNGPFKLIAYFFKPVSLFSLFGIAAHELTDKPIDLHLLSPVKTIELQDKLLNTSSIAAMIQLIDGYIFELTAQNKTDSRMIHYAASAIAKNISKETLQLVQKDLHVTERTFQRMFEKNIGLSPNLYRRICQFDTAFWQLNQRKFSKLSDIAFENGYADQSHYIRAFKEFTNITPKDYLSLGSGPVS